MSGRRTLRVLCFGDSLTAGTPSGNSYSHGMARMVQMAMPDTKVHTEVDGEPGATVLHGFQRRMRRQFPGDGAQAASSSSAPSSSLPGPDTSSVPPFEWAIVLGGTNDLAQNHDPDDIFQALKDVWEIALSSNTRVLALTVPEIAVPDKGGWMEQLDAARHKLNNLIRTYEKENFYVYDLHDAMRYLALPPHDRDRYWNDVVHFTAQGYDNMGERIGVALVHILVKEKIKSETQRQPKQDEGACASSSVVNQEYVVVPHGDSSGE